MCIINHLTEYFIQIKTLTIIIALKSTKFKLSIRNSLYLNQVLLIACLSK